MVLLIFLILSDFLLSSVLSCLILNLCLALVLCRIFILCHPLIPISSIAASSLGSTSGLLPVQPPTACSRSTTREEPRNGVIAPV
ncbi:hypothetical protein BD779DRAFT_1674928 [Infundibulicybe gibba]|nr:hypothetical protein BD779DRAFT_1674928 [Infundibulicybe gibba]